ncbi:M-phase inducer phosphatase 3-like, partial [Ruditapes philippinarum]|uniref:M-phase inducer phosphatase 3-like n=1 Tax=Ruditapes philippinarum TaxID=129788 RepID=UPI00295AD68E
MDSPVQYTSPQEWNVAFDTPFGKSSVMEGDVGGSENETCSDATRNTIRSLFIDEDSGLGMDTDTTDDQFILSSAPAFIGDEDDTCFDGSFTEVLGTATPLGFKSKSAKKKLFNNKRIADIGEDNLEFSPCVKRFRKDETNLLKFALQNSPIPQTDDDVSCIIRAVDRLTTEVDLVADGSRDYSLPTVRGKHGDLKSISAQTMADIVKETDETGSDVMIVDCRYPYEFEGGHIKGAVNLYTKEDVYKLLELSENQRPRFLVFHCEFSSERGPK